MQTTTQNAHSTDDQAALITLTNLYSVSSDDNATNTIPNATLTLSPSAHSISNRCSSKLDSIRNIIFTQKSLVLKSPALVKRKQQRQHRRHRYSYSKVSDCYFVERFECVGGNDFIVILWVSFNVVLFNPHKSIHSYEICHYLFLFFYAALSCYLIFAF